jgi:hypothetical protein
VLPLRPPRPLDRFGIWSIKESYNLNYNIGDGFVEFFHGPDKCTESWGMVWKVRYKL